MRQLVRTKEDILTLLRENGPRLQALGVRRLGLFGSFVRGEQTPVSDVDLLVVQQTVDDPWGDRLRIREALYGMDYPFDVILISRERFERTKGVIGGLSYPADKQGRIIYAAA